MGINTKQWKLFYSWQSDINPDCNRKAIKNAINQAIPKLEEDIENLTIEVDEATRELSGSPNIPAAIFQKITLADIFICDLTTINNESANRKVPNPNVLIELGFAIAFIGWNRIIIVFNDAFGTFPDDLPFDIDRHRALRFAVKDKIDNNGKGQLRAHLTSAITEIIKKDPPRPESTEEKEKQAKKRQKDVSTLIGILSNINLVMFERFLNDAPKLLDTRILHYWEGFHAFFANSSFHLFDQTAHNYLSQIHILWEKSLSYEHNYREGASEHVLVFGLTPRVYPKTKTVKEQQEQTDLFYEMEQKNSKELKILRDIIQELRIVFSAFLKYLQDNYLEIDLETTSKAAIDDYNSYHK